MSIKTNLGIENSLNLAFDNRRLQQVLLNLLSNASKFQTSGEILVSLNVENIRVLNEGAVLIKVSVEDRGIGMTADEV